MKWELPLPPTTNNAYGATAKKGHAVVYKRREAKNWEEEVSYIILGGPKYIVFTGTVEINIVMYLVRNRDVDGSLKLLLDVLQNMQVYKNDSQIMKLTVEKKFVMLYPRIEIEVTEYIS